MKTPVASSTRAPSQQTANLANLTSFLALITTGLSAGFFYAWQVGSIPGLRLLDDVTYIQTMNAINATIRNFGFGIIFFGSFVLLLLALLSRLEQRRSLSFALLAAALLLYLVGPLFITFSVHVPLNTELLTYTDLSTLDVARIRADYQGRWNSWHLARTCAVVASFGLLLAATFTERKPKSFQLP